MTINTINNKESFKLDKIDKKLFYYLSQNIKWPRKQLAKKLKISSERLNYRIDRLLNNIIEPIILINYPLLDIQSFVLFIKEQLDPQTISKIQKADETYLFTQCVGEYHHMLHIITNNLEQFMIKHFSNLTTKEMYKIENYYPDNYDGFNINDRLVVNKKDNKITITKNHYFILKNLIQNPLMSNLQLSQETKIDRRQIKKIVDELYNNNYIQKFRFILNSYKVGFETYLLKIHFNYGDKKRLIKSLQSNNYSGFIYESIGTLYMWYLPTSHQELFEFVSNIESKFNKVTIKTIQPTDLYTLNFMPNITKKILKDKINKIAK